MPPQGIYLPFEDVLTRKALLRHVHRVDVHDGMVAHRRTPATPSNVEAARRNGLHMTCSPMASVPHASKPVKPLAHDQGEILVHGTMDVTAPQFSAGAVRCRMSKCINTRDANVGDVEAWLNNNCAWRRAPVLGIGKFDHDRDGNALRGRAMTAEGRQRAKRGTLSPVRPSVMGSDSPSIASDEWRFLRHLPGGIASNLRPDRSTAVIGKRTELSRQLKRQSLHSDVVALLSVKGPAARANLCQDIAAVDGVPVVLDIVRDIPAITSKRWQRTLRPPNDSDEALAVALAEELAQQPLKFRVGTSTPATPGASYDGQSLVQLIPSMAAGSSSSKSRGKNVVSKAKVADGVDGASNSARAQREGCWRGVLKVLDGIKGLLATISMLCYGSIDVTRLLEIVSAVDRSESLRLCGGLTFGSDKIHSHRYTRRENDDTPLARRGLAGLSSEWVVGALTETSDDEGMQVGDSVRMLSAYAIAAVEGKAPAEGDPSLPPTGPGLTQAAWLSLCHQLKLHARVGVWAAESHVTIAPSDPEEELELEVDPAEVRLSAEFYDFVSDRICALADNRSSASVCSPILLELLLQLEAAQERIDGSSTKRVTSASALVSCLLWEVFGWDTPVGRRLIRRMCQVFNEYADYGNMAVTDFIKVCSDAGWVTNRDVSAKHARFVRAFSTVANGSEQVPFHGFIVLMEMVARWRCSEGSLWPSLEANILHLTRCGLEPTSLCCDMQRRSFVLASLEHDERGRKAAGTPCRRRASGFDDGHSTSDSSEQTTEKAEEVSDGASLVGSATSSRRVSCEASSPSTEPRAADCIEEGQEGSDSDSNEDSDETEPSEDLAS